MKKLKSILIVALLVLLAAPVYPAQAQNQAAVKSQPQTPPKDERASPKAPRPIDVLDILAWKGISGTALSTDGQWFAYRLSPMEGDGEVIIRQTKGAKEYKFPAGEGRFGPVSFSEDAKYCAFTVFPTAKEAKALRKEKKPVVTKAALVNLATGDKVEYEKIKNFAFSRENPAWLALLKNPPDSQAREKDKWSGSDSVLRELAAGKELLFGNVSEFSFDKKGQWLAMVIDAFGLTGNGVELRNMATGVVLSLDSDKANYKSLTWTEKGEALACLKGKEEKGFEDKFYSVVGFTGFSPAPGQKAAPAQNPAVPQKVVYDPKEDKTFPKGMTVSPNRSPQWTESLDGILFGIYEPKKKKRERKHPGPAALRTSQRLRRSHPPLKQTRIRPTSFSGTGRTNAFNRCSRSRQLWTRISASWPFIASRRRNSSAWPTTTFARSKPPPKPDSPSEPIPENMSSIPTSTAAASRTSI